ncbi:MAG TPA: DegT/DnrJ/EryC1/StrS family aminotransferase [Gaiellaceae bacterium]
MTTVRFYDPSRAYMAQREELDAAFRRVLGSERIVLGREVEAFEHEFAESIRTTRAVGVASGTDALELALRALSLPAEAEVICPNLTAIATPVAILRSGLRPVLVDSEAETLTLDPARVAEARSSATAAIVVVHLYGRPARLDELFELGLPIVEDASHAHGLEIGGRPAGSIGVAGCFSFYPTKNLGAFGDAGAVVTSDGALAERVRELRAYGQGGGGRARRLGANSRLDELQAAFLRVRLRRLEADNRRRAEIAAAYDRALGLLSPAGIHHLYVLRSERRDELRAALDGAGVETAVHYPWTVHEHPLFGDCRRGGDLGVSTLAAREVLSLPCYAHLTDGEQSHVVEALASTGTR